MINLADVPEVAEREVLGPGVYNGFVSDIQTGNSKRSGNPMLTWILSVTDKQGNDHQVYYHTLLNDPRGLTRIKRAITNLLEEGEDFDFENFRPAAVVELLQGRNCRVQLGVQNSAEYGKSNTVREILPVGGGFMG